MKISKVLLTGASGKVGKRLLPALIDKEYSVRVLQFSRQVKCDECEIVTGSITDREVVRKAVQGVDAVIHLATSKESREGFLDVSMKGNFELLEACREADVKQVLLASGDNTIGIYYYPNPYPLDETGPLRAYPGYYALSKVMEETMYRQYWIQYNVPVTILRCSWIQDYDDILRHMTILPPDFGIPVWKELASDEQQREYFDKTRDAAAALLHENGSPYVRHVVSVHDVVHAFLKALGNKAALGETFNIAAPSAYSYLEAAEYIGKKLDIPVVSFYQSGFYNFTINIGKARSILGYSPKFDIFNIIDQAVLFRESGGERDDIKYEG